IIVFLVVAVLLFISVKDYFTQDKVIVKIVILNSAYDDAEIEKMEKKIAKELKLTGRAVVKIDPGYSTDTYDSKQALMTLLNAGSVDIVIGDEKGFDFWAQSGYFMCPEVYDQVKFYEDIDTDCRHYTNYTSGRDIRKGVKGKGKYNYGIKISDSSIFKSMKGVTDDEMFIGVNVETKQDEYSLMAEKYLLGEVYKNRK
nr:hypothetical protein [Lachnospiraceae bacterium]